jgi:hypothetical protein
MAQYKKVRRNGRWITVDEKGREVKPGQGQLRDLAKGALGIARSVKKAVGDNLVYSDRTDSKGNPMTVAQSKRLTYGPGGSPSGTGEGQARQTNKPGTTSSIKPKPKPEPISSKPQPKADTTTSKPKPKPAASTPSKPKPKFQGQSKNMDENYRRWAAANPTLAKKVKKGQAGYEAIKGSKLKAPASKKGSTSPSSAVKPASKKAAKPQSFISLSEKMKKKRGY